MSDTNANQPANAAPAAAAQPAQPAAPVATSVPANPPAAAAPAAPAVAATPTQPANPATPAEDTEQGTFGPAVKYAPTGDSNLDLALGFVGKHGLDVDHPAIQAATKGNFGPLKAMMAEKGVQGWEAYIALAEKGYADYVKSEAEKTAAIQQIVVQAAGGEQEWNDVLQWASANAEPHEKEQVNAALAQGGVVAEAMAAYLVNLYRGAPGTSYAPQAQAVKPDAARGSAAPANGPLSPKEFALASQELRRTKGVNFENTPEYKALVQRRMMYRG